MTPEVKIFEIVVQYSSTGHDATFRVQIWWKSAVAKLPKGRLESGLRHKKLALLGLVPAPIFFPKWTDHAQNSLNVVTPEPFHAHQIWSGLATICRTYCGTMFFVVRKVIKGACVISQ